ncbi:cation:proton antiporter [Solicola sp. PLA-1-18]|uniref:cation:proton antiporter n=1 Tax=Solicola sp. PLA-1-18 TaxID=3380532 RepID=UPI003B7D9F5E
MDSVVLIAAFMVGVVVLTPLSGRVGVPQPVALTIFGLCLALLPAAPDLELEPELILPVVLPPLLFAATQRATVREFRDNAGAVLFLAVGLTLFTIGAVATVAHVYDLPWWPALVLGSMVSPPDPVAATAVARKLRLPHRLVTILEGEGMFNDATALVAFNVTLAAVVTGQVSGVGIGVDLVLGVLVGVAVGLGLGVVSRQLLTVVHDAYAETTLTVLVPFLAYIGAERLGGSGVLAVLALGLFLRTFAHTATTSRGWLLGRAVWSFADFLVTSLVFTILGYELVRTIGRTEVTARSVVLSALVVATLVVVRGGFVFTSSMLAARRAGRRDVAWPSGWRESAVVSWAGMRGVVTVAAALALPVSIDDGAAFPGRDQIVVVALVVVLVTLVLQGLTLAPLTSRLGVTRPDDDVREVAELRRRAAQAALDHLRGPGLDGVRVEVAQAATLQYEGYLSAQQAIAYARTPTDEGTDMREELGQVLRGATGVERSMVLAARRRGTVSPASADDVLRDIEGRALRDFG